MIKSVSFYTFCVKTTTEWTSSENLPVAIPPMNIWTVYLFEEAAKVVWAKAEVGGQLTWVNILEFLTQVHLKTTPITH